MESELTEREIEAIKKYSATESLYMAKENFYADPANLKIRKLAVSVIAKHWMGVEVDAFVPYLAMNYFDNFVSHSEKPYSDIKEVPKVAITCLTIAASMREISVDIFPKDIYAEFDREAIKEIELRIHNKLERLMKPVTPFCFLNLYYPAFRNIKHRYINEIIVQAQGEEDFTEYKPSDIAFSSFLAATRITNPLIDLRSIKLPDGLNRCDEKLCHLCKKKGIKVETAGSETALSSIITVAIPKVQSEEVAAAKNESESNQQRQAKGKAVAEIVEEKKDTVSDDPLRYCPKTLMDFMLLWQTDDPFLVKEPIEESHMTSVQAVTPVSEVVRVKKDCCNIS